MEITIKRYSRKLTYEDAVTLDEFFDRPQRVGDIYILCPQKRRSKA